MERIEKLKEFLKEDPSDSFVQHALALEYIKLNDDATAQQLFEEILTREPSYVGSYYHLAKLHERNGNDTDAIKWYQKGIEQSKLMGDTKAYSELRSAYEELIY